MKFMPPIQFTPSLFEEKKSREGTRGEGERGRERKQKTKDTENKTGRSRQKARRTSTEKNNFRGTVGGEGLDFLVGKGRRKEKKSWCHSAWGL